MDGLHDIKQLHRITAIKFAHGGPRSIVDWYDAIDKAIAHYRSDFDLDLIEMADVRSYLKNIYWEIKCKNN